MGRAPCCDKVGLKKGPWTHQEDGILINYIKQHGHGNWRALPKLAGLLRCGKSCRLRWINYLRPDIKRGNFTREEEDTIIQLHEMLGNRWSAIAARLPGRTDNEIKNVWHTHLKKRVLINSNHHDHHQYPCTKSNPKNNTTNNAPAAAAASSGYSTSSSTTTTTNTTITATDVSSSSSVSTQETSSSSTNILHDDSFHPIIDDTFWTAEDPDDHDQYILPTNYIDSDINVISDIDSTTDQYYYYPGMLVDHHDLLNVPAEQQLATSGNFISSDNNYDESMKFWYDIFMGSTGGEIHSAV